MRETRGLAKPARLSGPRRTDLSVLTLATRWDSYAETEGVDSDGVGEASV